MPEPPRRPLPAGGTNRSDDLPHHRDQGSRRAGTAGLHGPEHGDPAVSTAQAPALQARDISTGSPPPDLRKDPITKLQLVNYAGASGDYNLVHTDDETARRVGVVRQKSERGSA